MSRCGFWFGTEERMGFIPTPLSGADMSPSGWEAEGDLLNGGAYVRQSWGTHKEYTFEWPQSSSRQMAQLMKSYRDGSFGRGLIYFIDPLIYDLNILPARWADPSMVIGSEGSSQVYGVEPEGVTTSGGMLNGLPVASAYYDLNNVTAGYRDDRDTVFVPIPEGYTLYLGAFHQSTGSGGVFATRVNSNGTLGADTALTMMDNSDTFALPDTFTGGRGVRLWIGKSSTGSASVTVAGIVARLYKTGTSPVVHGPWSGGMGHSGCRFAGAPTYIANSGVEGGRIGYAASFTEVGDWL